MADNNNSGSEEKADNDNAEGFNSSSFLDTSTAAKAYEVCTGPVTDGERAYLLRRGLAMEDSRGELYGEPSTIVDFEDSNGSITANTPSPGKQNQSQNLHSERSVRKSRASMASLKGNADNFNFPFPPTPSSTIENQMSKLVLEDHQEQTGDPKSCNREVESEGTGKGVVTPLPLGVASTIYSPITPINDTTPRRRGGNASSTPLHISQSSRVTRASVRRITELRELLSSSNLQDQPEVLLQEKQDVQDAEELKGCGSTDLEEKIAVTRNSLIAQDNMGKGNITFKEELDHDEGVTALTSNPANASNADGQVEVVNGDGLTDLTDLHSSLGAANVQMMEIGGQSGLSCVSPLELDLTSSGMEENNEITGNRYTETLGEEEKRAVMDVVSENALPPTQPALEPSENNSNISMTKQVASGNNSSVQLLQDVSNDMFNNSSDTSNSGSTTTSSGEEFDDTITRMDKILAMAEEQEQEQNCQGKGDIAETLQLRSPTPARGLPEEPIGTSSAERKPRQSAAAEKGKKFMSISRGSLQPPKQKQTPTLAKPFTPVRLAKQTPSTSTRRSQTPSGNFGNGSRTSTPSFVPNHASNRRGVSTSPSLTNTTPECRPKAPKVGHGLKTAFFFSPKPPPNTETVKPPTPRSVKTPTGNETRASPSVNHKPTMERGTEFKQPPLPSPQPLRAKKGAYFDSPARVLPGEQVSRKDYNSASTPIRPFTEPQAIQDTLASPVSTIYPSPVSVKPRPPSPRSAKPIPLQVTKLLLRDKDRMASPTDLLKKTCNYKKAATVVNSPVAAYIYSTPTPPRVHRVVKTTDNSNEKKGPIKPNEGNNGGVARSLPRKSGIPRLAAFSGTGGGGFNGNTTRILRDFGQNQQNNSTSSPAIRHISKLMKPLQYQGSEKIREKVCAFKFPTPGGQEDGEDLRMKVQVHKGFVDENTNATVLEDLSMNKAFIPVRVKEVKDCKND